MLLNKVSILPTGNEICSGVVIDTDSPAIMQIILEHFPKCRITRLKPAIDKEDEILKALEECVAKEEELVILVGGSGGGHRFVPTLGEDYTHSALVGYLQTHQCIEIYGKNGHLWSKLIAGRKGESIVVNVPGPQIEAVAATGACMECFENQEIDLETIVAKVAQSVILHYPTGGSMVKK